LGGTELLSLATASATGAWGDHGARRDRRAIRTRDAVATALAPRGAWLAQAPRDPPTDEPRRWRGSDRM